MFCGERAIADLLPARCSAVLFFFFFSFLRVNLPRDLFTLVWRNTTPRLSECSSIFHHGKGAVSSSLHYRYTKETQFRLRADASHAPHNKKKSTISAFLSRVFCSYFSVSFPFSFFLIFLLRSLLFFFFFVCHHSTLRPPNVNVCSQTKS